MLLYEYVFCLPIKAKKKDFLMFWIENKACWTSKVNFSQSRKNRHSAKGLVHGVRQKIVLFLIFFFSQKSQKETFFYILDSKECFLDPKSEILAKSKKSTFCEGLVHGFSQKMALLLICSLSKESQKETFFDLLERKECFLDLKAELLT